jgi:hypothetical protein
MPALKIAKLSLVTTGICLLLQPAMNDKDLEKLTLWKKGSIFVGVLLSP